MLALTDSALAPLCHLRHGPRPDRRRALELLAASRDGCTETVMLAHGFTVAQMVDLVRAGLRPQQPSAWLLAGGGRTIEVARVGSRRKGGGRWRNDPLIIKI